VDFSGTRMSNDNNNIIGIPFLEDTKAEAHLKQLCRTRNYRFLRPVLPIRERLVNTKPRFRTTPLGRLIDNGCGCAEQWCEHRSADLGLKKGTLDRRVRTLTVYQRWKPDRPDYDRTLFYFDGVPVWETIGTDTECRDYTISQLMRYH